MTIALSLIHKIYSSLEHTINLLSLLCLHRLSGNGFQRRKFLTFRVRRLLSSLSGVCLITRLGVTAQRLTTIGVAPPSTPLPGATVWNNLRRVCLQTANCRLPHLAGNRKYIPRSLRSYPRSYTDQVILPHVSVHVV